MASFPLAGLLVLELAGPPGAWVGGFLGDFGARVIKIERPGMPAVRWGMFGMRTLSTVEERIKYSAYNPFDRNKESMILDLKKEAGRNIFYRLVERADVIIEGHRPGVSRRLGIDYETLSQINEKIVYCAVTGYGQDGPYQNIPGHDINYAAISGLLELTGSQEKPGLPGIPVGDWAGFAHATIGILLALLVRAQTGKGQFIDISLTDGIISWMRGWISDYLESGIVPEKGKAVPLGGSACYNIYQTRDGYISIGCLEPWFWENLCRALGREDLVPLQYDVEDQRQVSQELADLFKARTTGDWFKFLAEKDVCAAPVNSLTEALNDPQVIHRGMLAEVKHPKLGKVKQVVGGVRLSGISVRIRRFAPLPGQDTERILEELGYTSKQMQKLFEEGAVSRDVDQGAGQADR